MKEKKEALVNKLEEIDRLAYYLETEKVGKLEAQYAVLRTHLEKQHVSRVAVSEMIKKKYKMMDNDNVNLDTGEIVRAKK